MIIHHRTPATLRAGRIYLGMVILGEALIFVGLIGLVFAGGGELRLAPATAAPFFLAGFAIKAGLPPLHFWLPLAHPAAPIPASSALSGVMIKAGLLGWLRFLPLGVDPMPNWGLLCLLLGLVAAFYGVIVGITKNNPKTVLAYSSISQMGLITAGLGLAFSGPQTAAVALAAVQVYALHHGLAKGALFLAVALVPWLKVMQLFQPGLTGSQRLTHGLLLLTVLLPALSLVGDPLTSGFIAKNLLLDTSGAITTLLPPTLAALLDGHGPQFFDLILSLSTIATALLMLRFFQVLLAQRPPTTQENSPLNLLLPLGLLVLSGLPLFWMLLGPGLMLLGFSTNFPPGFAFGLPAESALIGDSGKNLSAMGLILVALLLFRPINHFIAGHQSARRRPSDDHQRQKLKLEVSDQNARPMIILAEEPKGTKKTTAETAKGITADWSADFAAGVTNRWRHTTTAWIAMRSEIEQNLVSRGRQWSHRAEQWLSAWQRPSALPVCC